PARRLDSRVGFLADVQALGVRRARDEDGARNPGAHSEDGPREELPLARPRGPGDVPAGLGVQAGHGARRDAGAPGVAVRISAVHRLLPLAERQGASGVQELGPVRQPADGPADRARLFVRHVFLPAWRRLLVAPEGSRATAPAMGEDVRLGSSTGSDVGPEAPGLVPTIG